MARIHAPRPNPKLIVPDGGKAFIAEILLLKQQVLIGNPQH